MRTIIIELTVAVDPDFVERQSAARGVDPERIIGELAARLEERCSDSVHHMDGVLKAGVPHAFATIGQPFRSPHVLA